MRLVCLCSRLCLICFACKGLGCAVFCSVAIMYVSDKFHMAFHTRGHWLERCVFVRLLLAYVFTVVQIRMVSFIANHTLFPSQRCVLLLSCSVSMFCGGSMKFNYAIADFWMEYLVVGLRIA